MGARHHSRREIPPHNASPSGRRRSPDTRNTLRIGPAGHRQPGHRPGPDPLGGDRLRHRDAVLGRRHGASPAERQTPGAEPAPGPRCGAHTGTLPHPEPANLRPPDWWTGAAANRPESAIRRLGKKLLNITLRDRRWLAGRNASVTGRQCQEAVLRLQADPRSAARSRANFVVQVHRVIEVVPGEARETGFPARLLG